MINSVGACMLAATVWPTSTLRWVTMPSMGATIMVWSRLTFDWFTDASDCETAASACVTLACCDARRLGRIDGDFGGVEIALRDQVARRQLHGSRKLLLRIQKLHPCALELAQRPRQVGARLNQVGLHLLELRVEQRRVQTRDHLALLDDGVEVGAKPRDVPRHLAADLNGRDGLKRAAGADGIDNVAAAQRRRVDLNFESPRR